ncbi:MAG: LysR family transcriptional regulator [Pseudomonadota bacterium]
MHQYLRHLANFARVVEAGSMKAASELIGVAPSGLSDSVRILETRLGSPLLVRHRAGVTPTSEGERVYAASERIIALLNEALGTEGDPLAAVCRFSVPGEVANTVLVGALQHLARQHADLKVAVFVEDNVVEHGRFGRDYFLRIASRPQDYPGLRTIWSAKAKAILVASPKLLMGRDPNNADALAGLPVLSRSQSGAINQFPLKNPSGRLAVKPSISTDSPAVALTLATQGLGIAACLDFCARQTVNNGELVPILVDRFAVPITVRLLTPHHRKRKLDDVMIDACARLVQSEKGSSEANTG